MYIYIASFLDTLCKEKCKFIYIKESKFTYSNPPIYTCYRGPTQSE